MKEGTFSLILVLLLTCSDKIISQDLQAIKKGVELRNLWVLGKTNRPLAAQLDTIEIEQKQDTFILKQDTSLLGENIRFLTSQNKHVRHPGVGPTLAIIENNTLKLINNFGKGTEVYFDAVGNVLKVYFNEEDQFKPIFDLDGRATEFLFTWVEKKYAETENAWQRKKWKLKYNSSNQLASVEIFEEHGDGTNAEEVKLATSKLQQKRFIVYQSGVKKGIKQYDIRYPLDAWSGKTDTIFRYFEGNTYYSDYYNDHTGKTKMNRRTFDEEGRIISIINGERKGFMFERVFSYENDEAYFIETSRNYQSEQYQGGAVYKKKKRKEPKNGLKWKTIRTTEIYENGEPYFEFWDGKYRVKLEDDTWSDWTTDPLKYRERRKQIENSILGG